MRSDDRGKFDKINSESVFDNYKAHVDDNQRKELAEMGHGEEEINGAKACPKCGKAMLRANQMKKEQELESNPWFVHHIDGDTTNNDPKNLQPMHKKCATK
ncbi:HNH endonuclease [Mesoplasma lactucae]|uniref:HNH nuclease domain-containing protein n=1 Tax=Mesoplasma lactucae ATCC 49193 TaxID=81460 RepID=A0A291IRZ7_9MOLU|nr:HNH endonuclease [Mesoplasma lactucae]ATG97461.1 hypothetical protein CP520_01660 [Mesoplasma lactucae ATCC 49193]ATZ20084.1 hypothetical protein MLACT_v1c02630 [Mesoplasma lactucae ATCC 49193]MCL8216832.1 hypothetical protein [Mesoplasma lactucae ATCC 49193]